jgi:aminoglycoside phosphotransferase (APT) family kinase protein
MGSTASTDRIAAMPTEFDVLAPALARACSAAGIGQGEIAGLGRLSGGASKETWSFDLKAGTINRPLILRRAPAGVRPDDPSIDIETEAELLGLADAGGLPVPRVCHVLRAQDNAGRGYIMERIEGETLARRVIRDPVFAVARSRFARDTGTILARIHALDASSVALRVTMPADVVEGVAARHARTGYPRPVFDLTIRWLRHHLPTSPGAPKLVHGDFRNGNFIFGPDGVRAILDWEFAHRGGQRSAAPQRRALRQYSRLRASPFQLIDHATI